MTLSEFFRFMKCNGQSGGGEVIKKDFISFYLLGKMSRKATISFP